MIQVCDGDVVAKLFQNQQETYRIGAARHSRQNSVAGHKHAAPIDAMTNSVCKFGNHGEKLRVQEAVINARFKNDEANLRFRLAVAIIFGTFGGNTAVAQTIRTCRASGMRRRRISPVTLLPGQETRSPRTERSDIRKLDQADSPSYKCLPYGPVRSMMSTNPYMIVQTQGVFAVLNEHIDYRAIYTDGRKHPDDILDYPEWMGHSIGHWEGDTLVVDTIGMREETWLDTAGLEHSAKLHLTEKFQKTGSGHSEVDRNY